MFMLIHIIVSKLFLIFALSSLIFSASLINSDPGHILIESLCLSDKFGADISYMSNLDLLLNSLPAKAATTGHSTNTENYYTNSSALGASNSEVIYGLFLCRGDTTSKDCSGCVSTATTNLPSNCPDAKSAVIWYDKCMVRYSNESFIGKLDVLNLFWKTDEKNAQSIKSYVNDSMKLGCNTLWDIASQLGSPKNYSGSSWNMKWKYYSTKNVSFNKFVRINTMAQCTPDLAPKDCELCLQMIIDELPSYCSGSQRVRMLNPSCNIRCEIYQTKASLQLVPTTLPVSQANLKRKRTILLVILPISTAISILLCYGIRSCLLNRKAMATTNEAYEIKMAVDSYQFDFNTIRKATCNFAGDNKLGQGGFGEVYKGKLDNGEEIAVKRLSKKSEQGAAEFKTEAVLVAKLQHKNLVKLWGFCLAMNEKILVYEFLSNSSLDRLLFDQNKQGSLDWQTRFKVIVGIARGLLYLHEDSPLKVIHRDLKSSNILLDKDMNPKISDFGLAKLFGVNQTQDDTNRIVGTYGYMAPEYVITGHYSAKSDIYSFGIIVLEIVSGKRNRNRCFNGFQQLEEALLHRAWRLWNEKKALDLVDITLLSSNFPVDEVLKCIHIGLLCIQECAGERPRMTSIVAALSGQSISLPLPKPPHFFGTVCTSEDNQTFDVQDSPYTGTYNITELNPRD